MPTLLLFQRIGGCVHLRSLNAVTNSSAKAIAAEVDGNVILPGVSRTRALKDPGWK